MSVSVRRCLLVVTASCLVASGCATVIEGSDAPTTTTTEPVATVPSGPAVELLGRMAERIGGLSEIVVETGGQRGIDRVLEIEALWDAARPEIAANRPELVADFQRVVDMCRTAVERRRPADADKALVILASLVAAYESTNDAD